MINISKERYLELLNAERILNDLYAGGVDNWDGYGEVQSDEITEEDIESDIVEGATNDD